MAEGGRDEPKAVRPLPAWVPAGWYPDPLSQGSARYWDGKGWTLEYRDSPPPEPVPTSPSEVPASPAPPKGAPSGTSFGAQPGLRERWREASRGVQIIIVGVGLFALIAIISAVAGGGKKDDTTASSEPVAATAPAPEQKATAPPVALKLATGDFSMTGSHTTLHGTVTAGAAVTVDEEPAHVHGTHWSKTVALQIGGNEEAVEATLVGHEPSSQAITVTRHHTQAELEAKAQARREREQKEREEKAAEERKEHEEKEIEDASLSKQNALKEAESYLQGSSFSEAGLIDQLSSEAGSGFPHADAVWAVEHLHVDWNAQAVKEAESYLKGSSFSCQGLTDQLSSEAGSQFTLAQAEYAARQVGLC
jgi:hypothetical protein